MAVSERLKKLPNALIENDGKLGQSMESVGYSENYSRNPHKIKATKGWAEVMEPVVKQLEQARQEAIERMRETVSKAKYADVSASVERLTKQIQLLSGGKTENIGIVKYDEMSEVELLAIVTKKEDALLLSRTQETDK